MLTVKRAAIRLGFTERTIRHFLSTGQLHGQKMGRQWRISNEEIRRFEHSLEPSKPPEETTSPVAVHPSPEETRQSTTKAHDDHLDDIRNLLLDWQRELAQQTRLGDAGLTDTSPLPVEAKRLFRAAQEHCPSIRNTYDELGKRRQKYEEMWAELESEIRPLAPREAVEGFAKTAIFYGLSLAQGNPGPSYYEDRKWLQVDQGPQRTGIAQGSAESRSQIREKHLGLIEQYSKDQRVLEMVNMVKAILEQQQQQLAKTLEGSILRKEYRTTNVKCEFCPR